MTSIDVRPRTLVDAMMVAAHAGWDDNPGQDLIPTAAKAPEELDPVRIHKG